MATNQDDTEFDRQRPLGPDEIALALLEQSWADFVYGVRVKDRYIRAESRPALKAFSLDKVHRILDGYKAQLDGGNRTAIYTALIYCVQENVPLPYWLGDEILDIDEKVQHTSNDLHKLFGLAKKLPSKGKRAVKERNDLQLRKNLWVAASRLMGKPTYMSKDAAVKQAREKLRFPYEQRKSIEMFDEQARIKSAYLDAGSSTKRHAIK